MVLELFFIVFISSFIVGMILRHIVRKQTINEVREALNYIYDDNDDHVVYNADGKRVY